MFQAIKILCVEKYQSYSKYVSICKCFEVEECTMAKQDLSKSAFKGKNGFLYLLN